MIGWLSPGTCTVMYPCMSVSYTIVALAYPCGYNSRLRFVAITINTTIDPFTINFKDGLKLHEEWESFITNEAS